MNEKHTIIRFAAKSALPIITVHACFAAFWFTQVDARSGGEWLPIMAVLFTGLVAPIYLAVFGCHLIQRRFRISVSLGFAILLSVLALDFFLDYALWGISSGQFRTPDEGTIDVFRFMAIIAATAFVLPLVVAVAIRLASFRSNRNANLKSSRSARI